MLKRSVIDKDNWYLLPTENLEPFDYLLSIIAYHSAPALESEKPAVLLTFSNEGTRRLNRLWLQNRERVPQSAHFRFFELRRTPKQTTVLFYHPASLQKVLWEDTNAGYLRSCGYREELTLETALSDLKARCQRGCPHEIGIFLGIPLPDVLGFIENRGQNALAGGYWKIYHDPVPKLALFARYQEAKRDFIRFISAGNRAEEYLLSIRHPDSSGL